MLDVLFQAMQAATDQLRAGFAICGADARLFYVNRAANEMIEAGWPVRRHNQDYLRASDKARHEVFVGGLREVAYNSGAVDLSSPGIEVTLSSPRSPRGASIATIRPLVMQEQRLMSVYITAAGTLNTSSIAGFSACFGLTPAEARTLGQILGGACAREAALALRVSHNTVKTHLRNIFAKTGTGRQPDLLKLFAELAPPLRCVPGAEYCTKSVGLSNARTARAMAARS